MYQAKHALLMYATTFAYILMTILQISQLKKKQKTVNYGLKDWDKKKKIGYKEANI